MYKQLFLSLEFHKMATSVVEYGYDMPAPAAAPVITAGNKLGALGTGAAYTYVTTFVTAFGETTQSPASNSVTTAGTQEVEQGT